LAAPVADRAPPPLSRNREFALLWSGQALSGLGSQISTVAYPLLVLAVTGSPAVAEGRLLIGTENGTLY